MDELSDAVVDSHTGTHRPHFIGHVGEISRLNAGDRLHLGGGFHLEYSNGIGPVHHLVHCLVVEIDPAKVDVAAGAFFNEQQGVLHLRQSPQGQEVDFDESALVYAVLIPVTNVPLFNGALLHRRHFYEGRRADNHAAGVLGQVLGKSIQLGGQVNEVTPGRDPHLVPKFRQP